MSERLIRVERFEELRAGMVCVGGPCGSCSKMHRFFLLSPNSKPTGSWDGNVPNGDERVIGVVFPATPAPACFPAGHTPVVTKDHVDRGRIWRVDDGLDLAAETAEAKRKPVDTQQAWLDALHAYERAR